MPTYTYNISASFIGGGLGNSGYLLYQDTCGTGTAIAQVTKQELLDGFPITLETDVEKIYLIPILDDPYANSCVLGCGYTWSELILSQFVPSTSPTPTPTLTPPTSPIATPTLTPTPTVTPTGASPFETFGLHIVRRISSTVIEMEVSGPTGTRQPIANSIANALGDGNVTISTDVNGNNRESILNSYQIYREDETTFVTSINTLGEVWWYDDFPAGKSYCRLTQDSGVPSFSAPTTATNLKYLAT